MFNDFTFEVDLFRAGAEHEFLQAITGLTTNNKMRARFETLAGDPDKLNATEFLKDIDSIGKGRFAQRLSSILFGEESDACPPYIEAAFAYIKAKLK